MKCRLIKAVEDREHEKDVVFAAFSLLTFLTIFVSLWAGVA